MSALVAARDLPRRFTIATTWHGAIKVHVRSRGAVVVLEGTGLYGETLTLLPNQRVRVLEVLS